MRESSRRTHRILYGIIIGVAGGVHVSLWGCFPTRPRRSSPSIKQTPPPATREFECKPARLKPLFSKCAWKQRKSFHEGQNKRSPTTIPERSSERPFLYAKMPRATSVELSPLVGSWPFRSWCLDAFLRLLNNRDPGGQGSSSTAQVCLSTIWLGTNYGSLLDTSIRKPKWLWGRSSPLHYSRMCLFRPRLRYFARLLWSSNSCK